MSDDPTLPRRYVEPLPERSRKPLLVRNRPPQPRTRSRGATRLLPGRERGSLYVFEWVIAAVIVGIVLTIAIPAYKRATGTARAAACATNLQRLGQMFSLYLQDHDGMYPPLPRSPDLPRATRAFVSDPEAWMVRLKAYQEKGAKQDPFICPASDTPTYAYNAGIGAHVFPTFDPRLPPATEAEVQNTSGAFLAWDTGNLGAANNLSGWRFYYGAKQNGKFQPGDFVLPSRAIQLEWIYPRHMDGSNVLYCDGHVARVDDHAVRHQKINPFDPAGSENLSSDAPAPAESLAGKSPAPSPTPAPSEEETEP